MRKLGFKPEMRVHYASAPDDVPALLGELAGKERREQHAAGRHP